MEASLVDLLEGVGASGRPALDGLPSDIGEPGGPPGGQQLAVDVAGRVAQPRFGPLPPTPRRTFPCRPFRIFLPGGDLGDGRRGIDGGLVPGQRGLGLAAGSHGGDSAILLPPAAAEGGGRGGRGGLFSEDATHSSAHHRRRSRRPEVQEKENPRRDNRRVDRSSGDGSALDLGLGLVVSRLLIRCFVVCGEKDAGLGSEEKVEKIN